MQENFVERNSLKAWMLAARPNTLTGCAVPVMIGTALALSDTQWNIRLLPTVLCFLFAFIMQIDANFINDYFDFQRGNDDETRLGPQRACAQGWITVESMKKGIILTTALACLVGLPLVFFGGIEMVLVGIVCIIFCFLYTTHLASRGMGDLLVLVFFGIVPVCVTYYLEVPASFPTISFEGIVSSIACGLVIDTLLMVNNYRDIENDKRVHKRTLAVLMGHKMSEKFYLSLGWIAFIMGIVFIWNGHQWAFILPIFYLILHTLTYRQMVQISKGKALNMILGKTGRNIFVYGVLVSFGILL